MRNTTYFKGIEKTEAIENYLEKRLKALRKLIKDDSVFANVELSKTTDHHKSGDIFRAEINFNYGGKDFYASSERADLYAAIDEMRDEIIAEVKKLKGKTETIFRRGARNVKNIIKGLDPRGLKNFRPWKRD